MIYFTLPNALSFMKINDFFRQYKNYKKDYLKYPNTYFTYQKISFPFCYWNGELNNHNGQLHLHEDLQKIGTLSSIPYRINFSNINLSQEDFDNVMSNIILQSFQDGSTLIELSNFYLLKYIKENYPVYNCVLSENFYIKNSCNIDLFNEIIEKSDFALIELPTILSNSFDFIKQINNKKNIEISVNSICPFNCSNYNNCKIIENEYIYQYSENSMFNKCKKNNTTFLDSTFITIEDIKEKYIPLGIRNFRINDIGSKNEKEYFDFILNYFFNENKHEIIKKDWENF